MYKIKSWLGDDMEKTYFYIIDVKYVKVNQENEVPQGKTGLLVQKEGQDFLAFLDLKEKWDFREYQVLRDCKVFVVKLVHQDHPEFRVKKEKLENQAVMVS